MDLVIYYKIFHDPFWILLLSSVLFFPVRKLIWILHIRKMQKKQQTVSEEEKKFLRKKATFTSVFLCIVFSYVYVNQVFN